MLFCYNSRGSLETVMMSTPRRLGGGGYRDDQAIRNDVETWLSLAALAAEAVGIGVGAGEPCRKTFGRQRNKDLTSIEATGRTRIQEWN
jgi:hypothetical protein